MAYIGRQLARGENRLFDDISSSFNGSTTAFNLTISTVATAAATPYQLFVSLGGVMQKPNTDYTVAGNQITFTTAPAAGLSCWIMMQGDTIDQAAIPDASVTPSKISGSNFAFTGDIRLKDGDGSHYVGFASPTTVAANKVWTLPAADGSASQYLQTNGSGVLAWSTVSIGGATGIDFNDNVKARWGTGNDLEIFHNASNSVINDAGTGDLLLQVGGSTKATVSSTGFGVTGALTVSTNATISGNLTVSGTTTTVDSVTLSVKDKNIEMGVVSSPSDTTADGGGITLKGASDKTINWINSTDAWTFSEHINIASGKKLGVGGANYGTSGQVLTSGGSGAAPSWAALPPGGNTFSAVANGSIANNKAVKVDTDGKVSEITEAVTSAMTSAGASDFSTHHGPTGQWQSTVSVADDKIIFSRQVGNDIKVGVWTLSSGGSAIGNVSTVSEVTASTGSSNGFTRLCKVADNKFCLVWGQSGTISGNNSPIWARVATVSGTTITWGTAVIVSALCRVNEAGRTSILYDPDEERVVVTFVKDESSVYNLKAVALSISGTTITVGTLSSALTDACQFVDTCYDTTNNKVLCIFTHTGYGHKAYIASLTINGNNAPTFGSFVAANDMSSRTPSIDYDPNLNKFLYGYRAGSGSSNERLCANFGSCNSSGVISIQGGDTNHTQINNTNTSTTEAWLQIIYDDFIDKFHWVWRSPGEGSGQIYHNYITIPSSGNSLTVPTRTTLNTVATPTNFSQNFTKFNDHYWILSYRKNSGSSNVGGTTGWLYKITATSTNLANAYQYVGFADQAYTNGQTATIKTFGNTVDTLSGLTPGTRYYVRNDGTVGASQSPDTMAGVAISSSKMIIKAYQ
jgi:hypothetical protein